MGPSVWTKEKILQLIDAGMNCARINFSHGTTQEHKRTIALLKEARREKSVPLAIMVDTKGPDIRVGKMKGGKLEIKPGQNFTLTAKDVDGTLDGVYVHPPLALDYMKPKTKILLDDGYIICEVVEKKKDGVVVVCTNGGVLKDHKKLSIPGVDIDLPAVTEEDIEDIKFACAQEIDIIAASFIRSAEHILEIKRLLVELGKPYIPVLAKIENRLGVLNFDSIVQVADGIMVARGDLGVELPLEQVPILQKTMIRICNEACKPVITATQMLESMTQNPRPTRAEVSDVANAIYDSTSAVMLSGETSIGLYPIETVTMMRKIVEQAEKDFDYRSYFEHQTGCECHNTSISVALSSVQTAYTAGAKAIFAVTNSGFTARLISRFRPDMPIFAQCMSEQIYHQMAIDWGVYPVPPSHVTNLNEAMHSCSCFALLLGHLRWGDLIILTSGAPFGVSGTTNMMMVENIGDVLVRGFAGIGKRVAGKAALIHSPAEKSFAVPSGAIVVLSRCEPWMATKLKKCVGIVLQNHPQDPHSETCALDLAKQLGLSLVLRAAGAFNNLHEGMLISIDPERGLVFKGEVLSDDEMITAACKT